MSNAKASQASNGTTIPQDFRRALKQFQRGRFEKTIALCAEIVETDPSFFDALHLLAVANSKAGHVETALILFDRTLALDAGRADVLNNRGSALTDLGRYGEALASYDQALAVRADFADAHNNRGCVLMFMDRFDEALTSYGNALVLAPDNPDYMNNLGRAFVRLRRYKDALSCFDDAIAEDRDYIDAILNRGRVFEELESYDDAIECFGQAMKVATARHESAEMNDALLRRAGAFSAAGRFAEALSDFRRALRISPERHDILLGQSAALAKSGKVDEALDGFDKAMSLGVERASVLMAKSMTLNTLQRLDEALACSEELIGLTPDDPDAQNAHGLVLMNMQRFGDAMVHYERALDLRPDLPFVEWNLGYIALLNGRFREGFRWYEGRRRREGIHWTRLSGPEWRSEPLQGKRILIYAEQGLGDTIHFSRYVGVFARMGAKVIFGVYPQLAALLRSSDGAPDIMLPGERTPPYDFHLPLMSAPYVLGHDEAGIPGQPYIFAEPERVATWARRMPAATLKVGIAWQGSQSIPGRAIPLAAFRPLAAIPGVTLISLQKSDGLDQLDGARAEMEIVTLGSDFDAGPDAFLDTAAVMMNLDLVISCDTAVAHLAGALGRPLWIVLKTIPDWRWMLDREETPWYPTARLFRRREGEEWAQTMDAVAAELRKIASGPADRTRPLPTASTSARRDGLEDTLSSRPFPIKPAYTLVTVADPSLAGGAERMKLRRRSEDRIDILHPLRLNHRLNVSIPIMRNLLRAMIRDLPGVLHTDLVVDVGDVAAEDADVSFGRRKGSDAILLPDPYYFQQMGYQTFAKRAPKPFSQKRPKAFWRGSTTGFSDLTLDTLPHLPRYRLCRLTRERPDLLDAKITGVVQAVSDKEGSNIEVRLSGDELLVHPVPIDDIFDHQLIVDIDGNASSWGFVRRALSGCCILKVESEWEQWFCDEIRPWEHYVPIAADLSDLLEKIGALLQAPDRASRIGQQARAWALGTRCEDVLRQASARCVERWRRNELLFRPN